MYTHNEHMKFTSQWLALPLLTLALSSCNSISEQKQPEATYTLSGLVTQQAAPLGVVAQSLNPQSLQPQVSDEHWQAPHVAGEVLVIGSKAMTPQSLSATLTAQGLPDVQLSRVAGTAISVAQTPAGRSDQAFAADLAQRGLVVQPNYLYQPLTIPNDPGYPDNAGIQVGSGLYDQDYLKRINAQAGWDAVTALGKSVSGVLTAVLDTGVTATHPDLQGRLLNGADCSVSYLRGSGLETLTSCKTQVGAAAETDSQAHGTGITGLLGAVGNNGIGITGMTWTGQNLLPVQVFEKGGASTTALAAGIGASTTALAAGIQYAVSEGAKVINMSLGFAGKINDVALSQAIAQAASSDVLMLAAAGNTPDSGLYYPASDPNVLAVGAVGATDTLACYSARPTATQKPLDIVAPGGNAGTGTSNCFASSEYDLLTLTATGYTLRAGTSEATPLVSGTASLMRSVNPGLSAVQVANLLKSSAKTVTAGRLLDVGAAVQAAVNTPGDLPLPADYTLTVTAHNTDPKVPDKTYSRRGSSATLPISLPYSIPGLSAGNYTVTASLVYGTRTLSGQSNVTLNSSTVQTIVVK